MALLSTLVVSEITTPPLKPIAIIRYIARYLLICSGISRFDFKQPAITPNKKNQKVSNTKEDQYELKNRMKIEHINNRLKQNKSINTRYTRDIKNFESLVYLGCLKLGLQILI